MNYGTLLHKTAIKSDHLGDSIYNFLDTTFTIPKDFEFDVVTVTVDYVARPDLISLEAYGDTDYADVICKLNGISNPFELNEGDVLVIPTFDSLYYFVGEPGVDDIEVDDVVKPRAKSKTEKRKPNEAIIGDKRFHIDPSRRVIIY